jgi:uncharacterized membrane protein YqiK
MLSIFTGKLGLRPPTVAELATIPHDQRAEIKRIQERIVLQRGVVVMELDDTPALRMKVELMRRKKEARMEPMVVLLNHHSKKRS